MSRKGVAAMIAALALAFGALAIFGPSFGLADPAPVESREKPALGLFTSLPIYWQEAADLSEALDGTGQVHWVRTALEERDRLVPLDTLDPAALAPLKRLVMAQPRPLAPAENVALDEWVRGGGRLLLFADPMLTGHSRFMLGDKRRPQDVVLLSPILKRWGLELRYNEDQPDGERNVERDGVTIPVELPGSLAEVAPGAPSDCTIQAGGLMASCRVGKGQVTVVGDAALLDADRGAGEAPDALQAILARALG